MTDDEWVLVRGDVVAVMGRHWAAEDTRGRVMCGADGCPGDAWPCPVARLVKYWWDREIGD